MKRLPWSLTILAAPALIAGCGGENYPQREAMKLVYTNGELPTRGIDGHAAYGFTHNGKTFSFLHPSATVVGFTGDNFVRSTSTTEYRKNVYSVRIQREVDVCLFRTQLGSRYCVRTDCGRWFDVQNE